MKTGNHISIQSDVVNRLKKIRDGVVYDNILTFLFELIQNSQRAKSTKIEITVTEESIIISDNGVGCKHPNVLFTLDISGFGVGFGEGFSSIYTIADRFDVSTLDWKANVDVNRILKERNLNVDIEPNPFKQGFKIKIEGEKIKENKRKIISHVERIGSIIPGIDFYLNDHYIEKIDLFESKPHYQFHHFFDNRLYKARLAIKKPTSYGRVAVYYDYRYVCDLYEEGVEGTILIKSGKINLKAPDRKAIIYDDKRFSLIDQIKKDTITLLKAILKEGTSDDIDTYSNVIEYYLDVSDYVRFLKIDETNILNQYETREQAKEEEANDETPALETFTEDNEEETNRTPEQPTERLKDLNRNEEDRTFNAYVIGNKTEEVTKKELKKVNLTNIKRKSNVVWIEQNAVEHKQPLITKYEYYGIFTFISPHVLYDNALRFLGITHINDVEDKGVLKDYTVKNTGAKTKIEMRVMEILDTIEQGLGLRSTFKISDIDCKLIVSLSDKKIYQEKLNVEGYCQGDVIHLNRKALDYGDISSTSLGKENMGIHEVLFVLNTIELIAHELAHLIYSTEDNTMEHHEATFKLQKRIAQLFNRNK